jgi:hypothetical protein
MKMKTKKQFLLLTLVLIVSTFGSCRSMPGADELSTKPIVATFYEENITYSKYTTYHIPDSVILITDTKPKGEKIGTSDAAQLINKVKSNMNSRGFTYVDNSSNPDLYINMVLIKSKNISTIYYPGSWWGYYPGGYYPFYPWWGGGYYPGYSYTYSYDTGVQTIEMFDLKATLPNSPTIQPQLIWTSYSGGIVNTKPMNDCLQSIDDSFKQSQYIKK